jgi:hypothetical protein
MIISQTLLRGGVKHEEQHSDNHNYYDNPIVQRGLRWPQKKGKNNSLQLCN